MKSLAINLGLGTLFGWIIARAGVADFEHVTGMFALTDFHMYGVIGMAVPVAALGLLILRKGTSYNGLTLPPPQKPRHPGNLPGGMIFGAGWAITGACPGTALVQLGSGYWGSALTIAGAAFGILAYRGLHQRFFSWSIDSCG